jgi:hypothetical protein
VLVAQETQPPSFTPQIELICQPFLSQNQSKNLSLSASVDARKATARRLWCSEAVTLLHAAADARMGGMASKQRESSPRCDLTRLQQHAVTAML